MRLNSRAEIEAWLRERAAALRSLLADDQPSSSSTWPDTVHQICSDSVVTCFFCGLLHSFGGEEVHLDAPLAEWGLREVVEYMFEVEQTVRKLAKLLGYVAVDGAEFRQTE
jgi:hypothetical protein